MKCLMVHECNDGKRWVRKNLPKGAIRIPKKSENGVRAQDEGLSWRDRGTSTQCPPASPYGQALRPIRASATSL